MLFVFRSLVSASASNCFCCIRRLKSSESNEFRNVFALAAVVVTNVKLNGRFAMQELVAQAGQLGIKSDESKRAASSRFIRSLTESAVGQSHTLESLMVVTTTTTTSVFLQRNGLHVGVKPTHTLFVERLFCESIS